MVSMDRLILAYSNEKRTKTLLPYDSIVDEFNSVVQDLIVDRKQSQIAQTIQEIEVERIKYFVKEYILTRLDKIRKNIFAREDLMSSREARFFGAHLALLGERNVVTNKKSKECEYIGFHSLRNLENVRIDDQVVEILEGDFFVSSLDDVWDYLVRGDVALA